MHPGTGRDYLGRMSSPRIAIVGAGPGGLVAAIAARRLGLEPDLFEQAPAFQQIGGAIGIQSNGMQALDAIGLLDDFYPHLCISRRAVLEAPPGHLVAVIDMSAGDVPYPGFAVVERYVLQQYLSGALVKLGGRVQHGMRCESATMSNNRIELRFQNGKHAQYDVVIACDGANSPTRDSMRIPTKRIAPGEAYLRVICDAPHPDPNRIGEFWAEDGRRVGLFPLVRDRTYMFCTAPLREWKEVRSHGLGEWLRSWADFGEMIMQMFVSVKNWNTAVYDELTDLRAEHWHRGPLFLVGDAAHAMTPNLGQGANSAMVDAVVLMRLLAEGLREKRSFAEIGARYEEIRRPFVTRVQDYALRGGSAARWRSSIARGVRNFMLRNAMNIRPLARSTARITSGFNPREQNYLTPIA